MSSSSVSQIIFERESKLGELRRRIPDVIVKFPYFQEDFYLFTWLKMGKLRADKTERNIREATKWWVENDIDEAEREELDPDLAACFPVFLDGKTKTGFHVVTVHPGKFKHSSTIQKYGPERVLHYWIQILAKTHKVTFDLSLEAVRLKKFKGDIYSLPLIQKHLSIVDFNEMHFSDFLSGSVLSIYLAVVKMIVTNFQFLDGVIIVINAGKTAEIFLKLLRPLLRGSNLELVVFGSNENEWKPFILQYVDPSEIRPDFGGCKKD